MAGRRGPFLCVLFLREVYFIYFFGASSLWWHMMYLILRSTSTGLEPSFHTTQDRLTKLASKMIYLKSGISQRLLEQRLNADTHRRRQFTLAQRLHRHCQPTISEGIMAERWFLLVILVSRSCFTSNLGVWHIVGKLFSSRKRICQSNDIHA